MLGGPHWHIRQVVLFSLDGIYANIIRKFSLQVFVPDIQFDPTGPPEFRKQVTVDGETSIVEVMEVPIHEEYKDYMEQVSRYADGFILVYSITSRLSFLRLKSVASRIEKARAANDTGVAIPTMLIGNKIDKAVDRDVSTFEAQELAGEYGMEFAEVTAKGAFEVEQAFLTMIRMIRHSKRGGKPRTKEESIAANSKHGTGRRGSLLSSLGKAARRFSLSSTKDNPSPPLAKYGASVSLTQDTRKPSYASAAPVSAQGMKPDSKPAAPSVLRKRPPPGDVQSQPVRQAQPQLEVDLGAPLDMADLYKTMEPRSRA